MASGDNEFFENLWKNGRFCNSSVEKSYGRLSVMQ